MIGNMARGFIRRVGELIGGPQRLIRRYFRTLMSSTASTRDAGTSDYAFWDRARRGKALGLEISGLLLKPLQSKVAAWTLGKQPSVKIDRRKSADRVNDWLERWHSSILTAMEEAVGLGDCYLVVNADLTLTVLPPNVVRPLVDSADFGKIIGWVVEQTFPHPTEPGRRQTQRDEYTATERTLTITEDGRPVSSRTFRNLIGRVPVIHIPNALAADSMFGRPEGEALVPLLQAYGETVDSAVKGNKRQGRPTPAIHGLGNADEVDKLWEAYARQVTRELPDGTTERYYDFEFDPDKLLILSGNGRFTWESPSEFMGDTEKLLGLLFYLYLEHTELPEWVLGNAIASSKASAETQVEPLVKFIEKKRGQAEKWLLELIQVAMAYMGLSDVSMQQSGDIKLVWDDLTTEDGKLTLETVQWALQAGLITQVTAARLMPVDIENPEREVKAAQVEKAAQQQTFDETVAQRMADAEARFADEEAGQGEEEDEAEVEPPMPAPAPRRRRRVA